MTGKIFSLLSAKLLDLLYVVRRVAFGHERIVKEYTQSKCGGHAYLQDTSMPLILSFLVGMMRGCTPFSSLFYLSSCIVYFEQYCAKKCVLGVLQLS